MLLSLKNFPNLSKHTYYFCSFLFKKNHGGEIEKLSCIFLVAISDNEISKTKLKIKNDLYE